MLQKTVSVSLDIWHCAFKKAVVKPMEKKRKKYLVLEVIGKYRPVSNLPYVSKNLEIAFTDTKNLHVKFQSAYRHSHSI